ncbi:hypothetical protein ACFLZ3_03300 [Candidatus Omnitrophota bacterium]
MPRRGLKIVSLILSVLLLAQQSGFAQAAGELDLAGHLQGLQGSLFGGKFRPLHLRYLSHNPQTNDFKLLLDRGDNNGLTKKFLKDSTRELLDYVLIGIALPNDSFWVNLRPDSPDQIIDQHLGRTDIGRIFLEADLQLKKDTANFTSPKTKEGNAYWGRLYKKAGELFGSENISIPTLTRPWIVPGEIIIRETTDSAYVYKASLKVMLEQDYLEGSATYSFKDPRLKELNEYSSQLIRELILPKLTQKINTSEEYAPLRQAYYSLIIAQWFKQRFRGRGGLHSWKIDRGDLTGLVSERRWSKDNYFKAYQASFKNGEYNLQEPVQTLQGQTIRSYFSGGMNLALTGIPVANGPGTSAAKGAVTVLGADAGQVSFGADYHCGVTVTGGADLQEVVQSVTVTSMPEIEEAAATSPSRQVGGSKGEAASGMFVRWLRARAEKLLGRKLIETGIAGETDEAQKVVADFFEHYFVPFISAVYARQAGGGLEGKYADLYDPGIEDKARKMLEQVRKIREESLTPHAQQLVTGMERIVSSIYKFNKNVLEDPRKLDLEITQLSRILAEIRSELNANYFLPLGLYFDIGVTDEQRLESDKLISSKGGRIIKVAPCSLEVKYGEETYMNNFNIFIVQSLIKGHGTSLGGIRTLGQADPQGDVVIYAEGLDSMALSLRTIANLKGRSRRSVDPSRKLGYDLIRKQWKRKSHDHIKDDLLGEVQAHEARHRFDETTFKLSPPTASWDKRVTMEVSAFLASLGVGPTPFYTLSRVINRAQRYLAGKGGIHDEASAIILQGFYNIIFTGYSFGERFPVKKELMPENELNLLFSEGSPGEHIRALSEGQIREYAERLYRACFSGASLRVGSYAQGSYSPAPRSYVRAENLGGRRQGGALEAQFTGALWVGAGRYAYKLWLAGETVYMQRYSADKRTALGAVIEHTLGKSFRVGRRFSAYQGDDALSREHCEIGIFRNKQGDLRFRIEDLASLNGTAVEWRWTDLQNNLPSSADRQEAKAIIDAVHKEVEPFALSEAQPPATGASKASEVPSADQARAETRAPSPDAKVVDEELENGIEYLRRGGYFNVLDGAFIPESIRSKVMEMVEFAVANGAEKKEQVGRRLGFYHVHIGVPKNIELTGEPLKDWQIIQDNMVVLLGHTQEGKIFDINKRNIVLRMSSGEKPYLGPSGSKRKKQAQVDHSLIISLVDGPPLVTSIALPESGSGGVDMGDIDDSLTPAADVDFYLQTDGTYKWFATLRKPFSAALEEPPAAERKNKFDGPGAGPTYTAKKEKANDALFSQAQEKLRAGEHAAAAGLLEQVVFNCEMWLEPGVNLPAGKYQEIERNLREANALLEQANAAPSPAAPYSVAFSSTTEAEPQTAKDPNDSELKGELTAYQDKLSREPTTKSGEVIGEISWNRPTRFIREMNHSYYSLFAALDRWLSRRSGKSRTYIYPLAGGDLIPYLVGETVSINKNPEDLSYRGRKNLDFAGISLDSKQKGRLDRAQTAGRVQDALSLESYSRFVQERTGCYTLILKGFLNYLPLLGEVNDLGKIDGILRHLFFELLQPGDTIVILDKEDLKVETLAKEAGFVRIGPSADTLTNAKAVKVIYGLTDIVFPTAFVILEKPTSSLRAQDANDNQLSTADKDGTALGGIDFTPLPETIQVQGGQSPAGIVPALIPALSGEWLQIHTMIDRGIMPSVERIKDELRARCEDDNFDKNVLAALSCIASILRLEEEECCTTNAALRELLVLLESGRSAGELKLALDN